MDDTTVARATRRWLESIVVGLNLCPFAHRPLALDRVRVAVTPVAAEDALLNVLQKELALLTREPAIETTLLVHPRVLDDFQDYNQFLDRVDSHLESAGFAGELQVASFHPNYQFAGTAPEDAENYTNRSPYPMLHILREDSVAEAIQSHGGVDQIPARNIRLMNDMGVERLQELLRGCLT